MRAINRSMTMIDLGIIGERDARPTVIMIAYCVPHVKLSLPLTLDCREGINPHNAGMRHPPESGARPRFRP